MKSFSKAALCLALAMAATTDVQGQNPVIKGLFSADPTARVFNGKVYLYPSHDIISPVNPERKWFCMADYHVYSSENLVDWTDHGVILDQKDVPWGNPEGYSMWAPDCVYKNGKYYFYFPDAPADVRGFAVGVAVAEKPEGPFVAEKQQIKGIMGIDPCVLMASDGNAYIYWAGMGLRAARLKDNMTEIDSEPVRLDEKLPEGFKEGPFVFERNGKFYLTYPWVRDRTETLAYAMSDNPLGPFEFKGLIMEQSASECWTNHHSLVEYKGQWYLFYHHNDYSPQFDKNRSVRIDKVTFNADGTIMPVTPTLRGVGITKASSQIQLDRYSAICPVATGIDFIDPEQPFAGWYVSLRRAGSWVRYDNVEFDAAIPKQAIVRARSANGASLQISTAEDNVLTEIKIPASKEWTETAAVIRNCKIDSTCSVRAVSLEGDVDIDWITFR